MIEYGSAKYSMITVIIGAVINIILNPILIFGFNMGVKGAAIATVLSQATSALCVMKFLTGNKTKLNINELEKVTNSAVLIWSEE